MSSTQQNGTQGRTKMVQDNADNMQPVQIHQATERSMGTMGLLGLPSGQQKF
jgi:hypothetical protein